MKKGYDAVIIGGGIVGCATAFELAKRGVTDILLLEKGFLTSGATGSTPAWRWRAPRYLSSWRSIPAIPAAVSSTRGDIFW